MLNFSSRKDWNIRFYLKIIIENPRVFLMKSLWKNQEVFGIKKKKLSTIHFVEQKNYSIYFPYDWVLSDEVSSKNSSLLFISVWGRFLQMANSFSFGKKSSWLILAKIFLNPTPVLNIFTALDIFKTLWFQRMSRVKFYQDLHEILLSNLSFQKFSFNHVVNSCSCYIGFLGKLDILNDFWVKNLRYFREQNWDA